MITINNQIDYISLIITKTYQEKLNISGKEGQKSGNSLTFDLVEK
jgi:hypothetical protein